MDLARRIAAPTLVFSLLAFTLATRAEHKLKNEDCLTCHSDKTLTDFVIDVALQRADAIVRKNEVVTLTRAEWDRFQELLLNPPEPPG